MKILFVINSYYAVGNGMAASCRRTAQYLQQAGHEVRVLSGPNLLAEEPQPEFPLKRFIFPIFQPMIDSLGYQYASSDKKMIRKAVEWADVVHLVEPFVLQYKTIRIAKELGKPLTSTYHLHPENITCHMGPLFYWKGLNRSLLRIARHFIYNDCAALQCPTENVLDRMRRYHIKSQLCLISNGVIPDTCIRPETPPQDYLDPERPLEVIYIGRLSTEKDQFTLLEAMRFSQYAQRIRLHFAGQGDAEKKIKRLAARLVKEGILKYEPVFTFENRDGLRQLAAKADLAIHCATIEVEGLSIMEAMQQGAVPVIAQGHTTGATQFALDRRSRFPEKNPEALANRIDYWLSHPEERWEMGKKYAQSMEQYDIQKSTEHLIQMFRDACSK
ncbi:MAG: glycosyltransferase [Bacteroidales bacterium]|nr:glycosyltransferase [Bacteroidales bacterium]